MSTQRSLVRRLCGQRGQALIETALTLPIVLVISISIFEFGRALQVWQLLTNAAREGARVAVLPGASVAGVKDRVFQYMEAGGLENIDKEKQISVNSDVEIMMSGNPVSASQITIAYPYSFMVLNPVMQLIAPGSDVGTPITMTASALMRNEAP
jgi:Flp pilus assembly protein TadG